jgi:hypothetical protein
VNLVACARHGLSKFTWNDLEKNGTVLLELLKALSLHVFCIASNILCRTNHCCKCQVGSRLRHRDLLFSIHCLYTSLGYAAVLPKPTLKLVAQAQSGFIRKMMACVGRLLRQTNTIGSKWKMLSLLKAATAETRRKERERAGKANRKHFLPLHLRAY